MTQVLPQVMSTVDGDNNVFAVDTHNANLEVMKLTPRDREEIAFAIFEVILENHHLSCNAEPTEGGFEKTYLRLKDYEKTAKYPIAALEAVLQRDISDATLNTILDRPVLRCHKWPATLIL